MITLIVGGAQVCNSHPLGTKSETSLVYTRLKCGPSEKEEKRCLPRISLVPGINAEISRMECRGSMGTCR